MKKNRTPNNRSFFPAYHGPKCLVAILSVLSIIMFLSAMPYPAMADEKRPGLLSQMNNFFARLRGNREANSQSTQDKQKEEKKEETTTKAPAVAMNAIYPQQAIYGMAHTGFLPMAAPASPFAGFVASPNHGPMFTPMAAMPTHQFAAHHPPRIMHPAAASAPPSFGSFVGPPQMSLATNPFSSYSAPTHMIPMHNEFSDSFGSFGTYGGDQNDATDSFSGPQAGDVGSDHIHNPGGSDHMDSSSASNAYDDSYNRKK